MPESRRLAATIALAVAAVAAPAARAQDYPIVYVRCPHTDEIVEFSGDVIVGGNREQRTREMRGADMYDVLPDVSHFFGGFSAPCDLVLREPSGVERLLYDCSSTSTPTDACAAMDPAVSFDASTIAFTVFRGTLVAPDREFTAVALDERAQNDDVYSFESSTRLLDTREAGLYLVDVATGEVTALPAERGRHDSGPAWLSDGRLAFTSDRARVYRTLVPGTNDNGPVSQVFSMDTDGRNVEQASFHALAGEQHPLQLLDGRVAVSSWQLFGSLPFRTTNGSRGGFGTIDNFFHLYAQHPDGANTFALYGQHLASHESALGPHHAAHFIGQSGDGRLWTTDYYRANNNGLGAVLGFDLPADGEEGLDPRQAGMGDLFRPVGMVRLTSWADSSDNFSGLMPGPPMSHPEYADPLPWAGKLGHPTGAPDGGLLVTWGKGPCSTVADSDVLGPDAPPGTSGSSYSATMLVLTYLGRDTPACDAGVYLFESIPAMPSTHPTDMTMVVDTREWHELMARPVVPYSEVMGEERPGVILRAETAASGDRWLPHGTPFGLLGASSIINRETHPRGGITFAGEDQFGLQGTDTIDYEDDELCGVRILAVQPNGPNEFERLYNSLGERVAILGEFPVRNTSAGSPVTDAMGNPDTSFLVRFPADVPYLMQAVDCEGRTLNTDQTWQHLRPGERKTCGGCHVHSRPGMPFEGTVAATDGYRPALLGEGLVPLLAGSGDAGVQTRTVEGYGLQIELERDLFPIFDGRCNNCHSGPDAEAGLRLDAGGTDEGSTWYCLVADSSQTCVPGDLRFRDDDGETALRRPQLTRYLRFMNARGSLLYWKAAGERTDNRSDGDYGPGDGDAYDIDFGAAHPTDITDEELGMLARWIETGAAGGPGALEDTLPPTLSLVGDVEDGALTGLRVGTVDVPSGIDPSSLEVCVLAEDGSCAFRVAVTGELHGTALVALEPPLIDPNLEVRAAVADRAGNVAEVRRTVGFLLRQQAPIAPPADDEGTDAGDHRDADGSGAGGINGGGCACHAANWRAALPGVLVLVVLWTRRLRLLQQPNAQPVRQR